MPDNIIWERLLEILQDKGSTPNTFTVYLGEQLRKAREEAGLSQVELAKKTYRRRPSISDMENGKMMPDIATVTMFAAVLDKPILYFIHRKYLTGIDQNPELTNLEKEMLAQFRHLNEEEQGRAISQLRAMVEHLVKQSLSKEE
jgi:transcriptional regulator with XRE-family HTH domain